MARAQTADFDSYLIDALLTAAQVEPSWVAVEWADGCASRFHHMWLRDNCPCDGCVHQVTKEQTFELLAVTPNVAPESVSVSDGVLHVRWPDAHQSRFDAGWLRSHRYDDAASHERDIARQKITWDASLGMPPEFDGGLALHDDGELERWLVALDAYGCSLLHDVPCSLDTVGELAARIGIVRETNFGVLWDVKVVDDPNTNANTALPLPPHVDLPTREYQPGLQILHCIVNEARGGLSVLVDGFKIAEVLRDEFLSHYEVLTTVPWNWANRSKTSDYRWVSPPIVLDAHGDVTEVRFGNWLRAPLVDAGFDRVEAAYAAYRVLFELAYSERFAITFRLEPGDCMVFDNRRIFHARGAFDEVGARHLRGCYSERDELTSRLRMLARARRASTLHS